MDAFEKLDNAESLQTFSSDSDVVNSRIKDEKKSEGHSVIFHDSRGKSFIDVSWNPQKAKAMKYYEFRFAKKDEKEPHYQTP
jgi:hypothetical protein